MESTQNKRFKLGFIANEAGSYSSGVSFPAYYGNMETDRYEQLHIVDSTCRETLTYNSKVIVNNRAVNYYLMEGVCRYTLQGERRCYGPESELKNYNFYAFHVKEP